MSNLVKLDSQLVLSEKEDKELKYIELIQNIIDRMRLDTDRQPYTQDLLDETALSWKEYLVEEKVPSKDLMEVYKSAIKHRAKTDRRNPFCIEDMLSAWFRLQQKRADTPQVHKSAENCTKCGGFGVVKIPQNGKIIEINCNHE